MAETDSGGVKSARRVLNCSSTSPRALVARRSHRCTEGLGLPKSSLHGLLTTLTDRGWVDLHESTRRYRIGLRLWQVAQSFSNLDLLANLAQKHLEAVRDELNETVQLAVLDGIDNIYVAKVESEHTLRLVSHVGARLPAYATGLGKVLLAYLEPAGLRRRMANVEIRPFTTRTVSSVDALERGLDIIRTRGYGEDEGEYTAGVYCIAVPVRAGGGEVVAAMSCSIPSARFGGTDKERASLLSSLSLHAQALSDELSGDPQ